MNKQRYVDLSSDGTIIKLMGDLGVCFFKSPNSPSVIQFLFKYKDPFSNEFPPKTRITLTSFPFKNFTSDKPPIELEQKRNIMVNAENCDYAMVFEISMNRDLKTASVILVEYPEAAQKCITSEEREGVQIKLQE